MCAICGCGVASTDGQLHPQQAEAPHPIGPHADRDADSDHEHVLSDGTVLRHNIRSSRRQCSLACWTSSGPFWPTTMHKRSSIVDGSIAQDADAEPDVESRCGQDHAARSDAATTPRKSFCVGD